MNDEFSVEDLLDSVPHSLSSDVGEAARLYLGKHAPFDYEEFRSKLFKALTKPVALGSSNDCLTIDEIAMSVAPTRLWDPLLAAIRRLRDHAATCAECWTNVMVFRGLERSSWVRGIEAQIPTPVHAWLEPQVTFSSGGIEIVACVSGGTASIGTVLELTDTSVVLGDLSERYPCRFVPIGSSSEGVTLRAYVQGITGHTGRVDFMGIEARIAATGEILRSSGLVKIL